MKLLLTSAGFTNRSIIDAFTSLAEKDIHQLKLAFIPTAANIERGDKGWLINDLHTCQNLGFAEIDIVDISAIAKPLWLPRLENADVLFFGGGNTFHLMYWLEKSGLKELLPELLRTRIYVGLSAGSMVVVKNFKPILNQNKKLYAEEVNGDIPTEGLGFVTFHIKPHLNSPFFPNTRIKNIEIFTKEMTEPVYAFDDNSAIVINGENLSVISEGEWKKFN